MGLQNGEAHGMIPFMNGIRWIFMVALLLLGGLSQGQLSFNLGEYGDSPSAESYLSVQAQSSVLSYRKGEAFYVALQGDIAKPWHAYFRNPGTVGEAMSADIKAPEGFVVEGPYWLPPHLEKGMISVAYIYESPLVVWKITPDPSAPSQAEFSLSASAQVCSETGCMPAETKSATIHLALGDGSPNPEWDHKESRVEILGDAHLPVSATQTADTVTLSLQTSDDISNAYFFSFDNSIAPDADQKLTKKEGGYALTLTRNQDQDPMYPVSDPASVGKELESLHGILTYDGGFTTINLTFQQQAVPPPAPADTSASPAPSGGIPSGLLDIFVSLFLGGLILNLMPCVFPVIGLKIMSFVQLGGGARHKIFLHSMIFVLGILVSFWALSLLLIILSNLDTLMSSPWTQWIQTLWDDAGSGSRRWAVWMQQEWVVYGILLLLLTLGLSMFGLFEIGVSATGAGQSLQSKKGLWGSFFQGLMVTVVATPCSAPLLGAAIPAAMSLPAVWMMIALTFMALGLAFPYVILGAFPQLVQKLPRPGDWMESLKQGLSFLLFAAAAWFLDVYLAFVPESYSSDIMWMMMSLVVFSAAFWVYGRWCPIYRSRASRIWGFLAALVLLGIGIWGSMPHWSESEGQEISVTYAVAKGSHPEWNPWSKDLMEKALEEGHPVYVDFTAKWCATCQYNKKVAYDDAVYADFAKAGVVLMRADNTRPNAAIDEEVKRLKRSSVPINALYIPGKAPVITKELLDPAYLQGFLQEHLGNPPAATPSTEGQK